MYPSGATASSEIIMEILLGIVCLITIIVLSIIGNLIIERDYKNEI